MIPTWQTCPKCKDRFKGSDVIGYPCPACSGGVGAIDEVSLQKALNAMNQMYYEDENNDKSE